MYHDQLIQKVSDWLAQGDVPGEIVVCLDLPDFDWVVVSSLSVDGDLVEVRGREINNWGDTEVHLFCRKEQVKAAKLSENMMVRSPAGFLAPERTPET
jgi:hypothetical protein